MENVSKNILPGERSKELNCLLSSWQYLKVTCAQITCNGWTINSDNWKETKWIQSADIVNGNEAFGKLEVCYTEEKPELDEGPFLNEERNLIDAIGILLGGFLQKKKVESSSTECIAGG